MSKLEELFDYALKYALRLSRRRESSRPAAAHSIRRACYVEARTCSRHASSVSQHTMKEGMSNLR